MIDVLQSLVKASLEKQTKNFSVQVSLFPCIGVMPVSVVFKINGETNPELTESPYKPKVSDIKRIILKIDRLYRASLVS